jgi:raffinose/stachyose/melibiose transport system permease protein
MMIISITMLFPIIWMIYASLKTNQEWAVNVMALPRLPQFSNYVKAFIRGKMSIYFFNSIYNSVTTVVLVIIISGITGYFLSRYKFRGRNLVYLFFLSGMLFPIYALLIPIFIQFKTLNLQNARYTLLLPYLAFRLPVAIFLIDSFLQGIPIDMEEAAYIDGSSLGGTLFRVILPMCRPVIATIIILTFIDTWNEFPLALVLLSSDKFKTIPVGLTNFTSQYTTDYPQLLAALTIASLPVIICYLFFSRVVIQSVIAGAVKG